MQRRLTLGWTFGTLFTFIIVFFIFLYSDQQAGVAGSHFGWGVLAFITKWYLIISLAFIIIAAVIPIIILILAILIAKRSKKKRKKDFIDINQE